MTEPSGEHNRDGTGKTVAKTRFFTISTRFSTSLCQHLNRRKSMILALKGDIGGQKGEFRVLTAPLRCKMVLFPGKKAEKRPIPLVNPSASVVY